MTMSTRGGGCCFAASAAVSVPELRPEEGLAILTNDIDTVILDCDGVLWCGNEVLPHTAEVRRQREGTPMLQIWQLFGCGRIIMVGACAYINGCSLMIMTVMVAHDDGGGA
jgi:hypothetical protein